MLGWLVFERVKAMAHTDLNAIAFLREQLEELKEKDRYRRLCAIQGAQGSWVMLDGRRVLNLCSNNYLGLASHQKLGEAAACAARAWGCGSGASRLICGNMSLHELLERRIAGFKHTEAALLFNSGYTANVSIIPALVGRGDAVFSDEFNHASLIDGCRLSQAQVVVFPHNDMDALESRLRLEAASSRRRLIVVDTVFSMEGDLAPLPELARLAERYGCLLMVDEAHATGVLGPGGKGLVAEFGLEEKVSVSMGTLSKAMGSFGAFACGSRELVDFLTNTARGFIFTTALPPPVLAATLAALDILEADASLPQKVMANAAYLRDGLKRLGYDTRYSRTQIIPVVTGEATPTLEMSRLLLELGVLATAIRPPTVPEGSCRVRVTVMADHTRQDLDLALDAFEKAGRSMGII